MKTTAVLAASALVLLSACAAVQTASTGSGAASPSGTRYCWKAKLTEQGGELSCNWGESVAQACKYEAATAIASAKVTGAPREAGRCPNGQWLVQVTTK